MGHWSWKMVIQIWQFFSNESTFKFKVVSKQFNFLIEIRHPKRLNKIFFWLNCYFSKNLMCSPRGKYFHQKRHLWVKKFKSSNIMVIFKGDTFEKKVSPSVTKCHLWPKKVKTSVILTILKGDTFFPVKIRTLL